MKKVVAIVLLCLLAVTLFGACKSGTQKTSDIVPQLAGPKEGDTIAIFDTSYGTFKAVLFPQYAPKTVENFVALAKQGYYDGLLFHRIVANFVIQTGDPTGVGNGGESATGNFVKDEFTDDLHHYGGALGMANAGPDKNTSQFYVANNTTVEKNTLEKMTTLGYSAAVIEGYKSFGGVPALDFRYTVFGQVYEGMDVVNKINAVEVDKDDRPVKDIVVNSVTVEIYQP